MEFENRVMSIPLYKMALTELGTSGNRYKICREMSKETERNGYWFPYIDDLFDQLSSVSKCLNIDLRSDYCQMYLRSSNIPRIAFRTRYGHYEFQVLLLG